MPTVTHRRFSLRVEDVKPLIGVEMVTYLGKKIISVWLKAGIFFRAQRSMFLISAAEIGFRNGFDPAIEWSGKGNWSYSGVRLFPPNWQSILQLKTVVSSIIIDSVCPSLLFLMEYLTSVIF